MNADMIKDRLDEIATQSWELLGRGGADAKDAFHTPTLITQGETFPEARTVILRRVERSQRLLVCHSDIRASKIAEIQANPRVSWHLWHPRHRIQLRLYAEAHLHHRDALADAEWEATSDASRLNYGAAETPGRATDELSAALAAHSTYDQLSQVDTEDWRPNFCALFTQVQHFEYLMQSREEIGRAHV